MVLRAYAPQGAVVTRDFCNELSRSRILRMFHDAYGHDTTAMLMFSIGGTNTFLLHIFVYVRVTQSDGIW